MLSVYYKIIELANSISRKDYRSSILYNSLTAKDFIKNNGHSQQSQYNEIGVELAS